MYEDTVLWGYMRSLSLSPPLTLSPSPLRLPSPCHYSMPIVCL